MFDKLIIKNIKIYNQHMVHNIVSQESYVIMMILMKKQF